MSSNLQSMIRMNLMSGLKARRKSQKLIKIRMEILEGERITLLIQWMNSLKGLIALILIQHKMKRVESRHRY